MNKNFIVPLLFILAILLDMGTLYRRLLATKAPRLKGPQSGFKGLCASFVPLCLRGRRSVCPACSIICTLAIFLPSCYQDQGFKTFYLASQKNPLETEFKEESFFLHPYLLQKRLNHCQNLLDQLLQFDSAQFGPKSKKRYQSLSQECTLCLSQLEHYQKDPSIYNMGGRLKYILAQEGPTLTTKLERIQQHLEVIENYYEVGKNLLTNPSHTKAQLGAQKQLVALQFLDSELQDSIEFAGLRDTFRDSLEQNLHRAKIVLKDYLAFCESLYFEHQNKTEMGR